MGARVCFQLLTVYQFKSYLSRLSKQGAETLVTQEKYVKRNSFSYL